MGECPHCTNENVEHGEKKTVLPKTWREVSALFRAPGIHSKDSCHSQAIREPAYAACAFSWGLLDR